MFRKKLLKHLLLGGGLALVVFALAGLAELIPGIGYGVLLVVEVLILFAQGIFYGLTATNGKAWSTLNFILNFVLWFVELVLLDHYFEGSSIHRLIYLEHREFIFILGGFLWALNKFILDKIIDRYVERRAMHKAHG